MSTRLTSSPSSTFPTGARSTQPLSQLSWLLDGATWVVGVFILLLIWGASQVTNPFALINGFTWDRGLAAFAQGMQFGFPLDMTFLVFFASIAVVDAKAEFHWHMFTVFAVSFFVSNILFSLAAIHLHPFLASYLLLIPIGVVVLDNLVNSRFKRPRLFFTVLYAIGLGLWFQSKALNEGTEVAPDISGQLTFSIGLLLMQTLAAFFLFFTLRWIAPKVKAHRSALVIPISLMAGGFVVVMAFRLLMN